MVARKTVKAQKKDRLVEAAAEAESKPREQPTSQPASKSRGKSTVLIAAIGALPACLTAVLGYLQGSKSTDAAKAEAELSAKNITLQFSENPNFKRLSYPNYGLSLFAPVSWTMEDSPARLAGGEFNLVQRYEDTKGAVGMNFRLRPVQPNYINDPASQVKNQLDVLEKISAVQVGDVSISGMTGKLFDYETPTGARKMRIKLYWVRLVPDVQLQIICAEYTDSKGATEFWRDVDQVLSSIVIAQDSWQVRYKNGFAK
ncbi:hypothetical protein [Sorangium sp. So ce363]|uniref:hypothetical protein n=1 Tax=Sorangium sp. So ce363 TaxID=3133304 RepID=UPI003F600584